ncbi:hypothetical protein EW093_02085 [Thiospirochaeta perfilievii]|uniref:Alpha/beta hydrolase n=1 Tax=Thiospirochaeta perfilievii TaxID=252967 RepID=A0A5C1Q808_9SPIO|nr:hypothetical protein [Thiospirochaeta perfilievii]QEN03537.1 hypothetical protein EW093_02085 [Thiospirochaeta perfilievii]
MKKITLFLLFIFIFVNVYSEDVIIYGFNFDSHDFSTSLESKSQTIYNDNKSTKDQVVIGHSQGGLKGAAYVKKMELAKNSNIDAFISVDSPVVGFAGLDYGYSTLRTRILTDVKVHQRGVTGIVSALPFGEYLSIILDLIGLHDTAQLNLVLNIADEVSEVPMRELFDTVVNKSKADSSIKEITDMGRNSTFVKKYVRDTKIEKVKYVYKTTKYLAVKWKKKGWIKYPVTYWATKKHYKYRDKYISGGSKLPKDIKIGHIVGTDNDPLRMAQDGEKDMRSGMNKLQTAYGVAGWVNGGKAVTQFWKAAYFVTKSHQCFSAEKWVKNYKTEWGDIIGGRANDGFISQGSQKIPGTPLDYIRYVKVDHARSTPPTSANIKANRFNDDLTAKIYHLEDGEVTKIKKSMGFK